MAPFGQEQGPQRVVLNKSNWRPPHDPLRRRAPAGLLPWLEEQGSLTARIRRFCCGRMRVRVLREYWGRPTHDEAQALRLTNGRYVRIREVLLMCEDTAWVYARTVMPLQTLRGRQRSLLMLGTRPLGSVLFGRLSVWRSPLNIRRLRDGDALLAAVHRSGESGQDLWARRSVLRFSGRALLVTEVFLPALLTRLEQE